MSISKGWDTWPLPDASDCPIANTGLVRRSPTSLAAPAIDLAQEIPSKSRHGLVPPAERDDRLELPG
ncbi:hypothetical protein E4U32_002782, partial [Claviceps aff. humidiphila group G2b]